MIPPLVELVVPLLIENIYLPCQKINAAVDRLAVGFVRRSAEVILSLILLIFHGAEQQACLQYVLVLRLHHEYTGRDQKKWVNIG